MQKLKSLKKAEKLINENKIGVIPTDTIYGVVGSALSPRIVEEMYSIKERDRDKPMIVLLSSKEDLKTYFELDYPNKLENIWPRKVSVVLSCKKYPHIHRGGETIAFRVPDNKNLRKLLAETGPIVAPSANPQGNRPSKTIEDAVNYFGDNVDFYVDSGELVSKPSTLIRFEGEKMDVLRKGAVNLEHLQ